MSLRSRALWGITFALVVLFVMVGIPSTAFADSMSFTIGVGNDTSFSGGATGITSIGNGNGYYGPYATVNLLLGNGSNGVATGAIRVTVDVASGYGIFGSQGAFAFNLANGLDPAAVGISFATGGYVGDPSGKQMSQFGKFEYVITDGSSPGHTGPSALVFTLTKSGGFSSVNDIVELSTGGAAGGYGNFAIQVGKLNAAGTTFVSNITNADGSVTQGTGFARDGSPKAVPEPTSLLMLGSGLLLAPLARKLLRRS